MEQGMTIKYLKYRADLNSEVDSIVNSATGTIVTKWDLSLLGKWIVFIHKIIFFLNPTNMPLTIIIRVTIR